MSIDDLLQWWNLIYAAPLLISLVWIVVTIMSGVHGDVSHGGHAHADVGHSMPHGLEHGHGVTHDVGQAVHNVQHTVSDALHGHHGAADGHGHAGHDHAHSHEGHAHGQDDGIYSKILWVLGIRQVPITLVFGIFMLCWGAFGLVVNRMLEGIFKYPAVYVLPSVGITFVASALLTRIMSSLVAKIMPGTETYAVTRFDMIGALGHAVYMVTETSGTVNIKDSYGTVHHAQCKAEPGAESIAGNTEVIVVDYDEDDKRFVVRVSDF